MFTAEYIFKMVYRKLRLKAIKLHYSLSDLTALNPLNSMNLQKIPIRVYTENLYPECSLLSLWQVNTSNTENFKLSAL